MWIRRGALAFTDQALFAGAHLVLHVLLARWLDPLEYGAFAAAYAGFVFLATLHAALFVEPMMVYGAGRYRLVLSTYLGRLFQLHALVAAATVVALGVPAVLLHRAVGTVLTGAILGAAVASGCLLTLWIVRRAYFVQMRPGGAAFGGVIYSLIVIGGTVILHHASRLSQLSAFVLLGAAAIITAAFLLPGLALRLSTGPGPSKRELRREHWQFGRWDLASAGPAWITGNVYFVLLPLLVGLETVADFRALMNVAMPGLQAFGALSLIVLPAFSGKWNRSGREGVRPALIRTLFVFTAGAVLYGSVIAWLWPWLVEWLYLGKYSAYGRADGMVVGMIPICGMLHLVVSKALRAAERPDLVFRGHLASGGTALGIGLPFLWLWGARGALLTMALALMAGSVVMSRMYRRLPAAGG